MRSLIVRFADCEGPGILAGILKEKKYTVTYHDAFRTDLELIPSAHQMFDLVVFMGGPASIADPSQNSFFLPYFRLAENVLKMQNSRMIGICLGAQLLAKVLGAEVKKGDKGPETGFGELDILHHDPVFQGISGKTLPAFHLHEDVFSIPSGARHLLSSPQYPSQMFTYENRVFSFQCHIEINSEILNVWKTRFPEVGRALLPESRAAEKTESVRQTGEKIFRNILNAP